MDTLHSQIAKARKRLVLGQFLSVLVWSWFAAFLVAAAAIIVQKFWLVEVDSFQWASAWLGGAAALGFVVAVAWTILFRLPELDAAIEIDRRFGLKERVSSSLALDESDLKTAAGKALMDDTVSRVRKLDVAAKFPLVMNRTAWLPAVPVALAIVAFFFLADPTRTLQSDATANTVEIKKQIKESLTPLPKQISPIREKAEEKNMPELADMLRKLEEGSRDLAKKDETDKTQAMSKLNDLAKELEQRKEKLAEGGKFKEQLAAMKNLPTGPADKLSQDLKNGDFTKALKELDKLQKMMAQGKLDEKQQKELADQMNAMKEAMEKQLNAQQKMAEKLEQEIEKAKQAGDKKAQESLQKQLAQLQMQQPQMNKMKDLAAKMGQCAQCMKDGKSGEAQAALNQMAAELQAMQAEASEMEMIDGALAEIEGCKACMGNGICDSDGNPIGMNDRAGFSKNGKGKAEGAEGPRPENVHDTKTYDSKVKQEVGKGSFVINGLVEGPNAKGQVMEEIKTQVQAAKRESEDPLTGQRLPRQQRDHVQQYFDAFRKGG